MNEHDAERWRAVLQTARDAIISIDGQGCIILFNRCAEQMFGYDTDEVLRRNVSMLMPPPYAAAHDGYIARYQAGGAPQAIGRIRRVEACRRDGEVFPIELAVSETSVGSQVCYTAIVRDVSQLQRAEAAVEAYRRIVRERDRRDDVAALVAQLVHDLGNPLAGISAQLQLVRGTARRTPDAPLSSVYESVELIQSEIALLESQVRELVGFSRRQQRLKLEHIVAGDLFAHITELWRPVARSQGVALDVDAGQSTGFYGDADKLRRVVENLVKNALEALAASGIGARVVLRLVETEPEGVEIHVVDDGPGVDADIELFRLFSSAREGGSGLGLALSRQLVQAHGGDLRHEPNAPHGARFVVSLPGSRRPRELP